MHPNLPPLITQKQIRREARIEFLKDVVGAVSWFVTIALLLVFLA